MKPPPTPQWISALQFASMAWIWVFVLGISAWIIHLIRLSRQLHDAPSASIAISIVAIPVFVTGASVLTYVFIGLRRWGRPPQGKADEKEERS